MLGRFFNYHEKEIIILIKNSIAPGIIFGKNHQELRINIRCRLVQNIVPSQVNLLNL